MKTNTFIAVIILTQFTVFEAMAQYTVPFIPPQRSDTANAGRNEKCADKQILTIIQFCKRDNYRNKNYVNTFYKKIYGDNATSNLFLQTVNTQLFGKNTYIAPEFLSFYCHSFPTRFGIGGSFKTTGDTATSNKIKSKLQNILQNGGNLFFNFDMPIIYQSSKDNSFHLSASVTNNWSFNSASYFVSDSSSIGLTWQPGIKAHVDLSFFDEKNSVGAIASLDVQACYFTGSKSLLNKLNISDFGLLQMRVSLSTKDISFFATYPIWSTSTYIRDNLRQITGGIALAPSNLLGRQ
ncbi:hypothetical protein [Niabella sp.]|uniref:hypothetical protein n=1 Tax=Niabella sp. TaxID=1962976 RepID=UPI00260886D9|nr:hypothetical protein [Niabella sp.]